MILICVFLMANDVKQLPMCLSLGVFMVKYLVSLLIFQIELFAFYCCVLRIIHMFRIQILCQICDLEIFAPSL